MLTVSYVFWYIAHMEQNELNLSKRNTMKKLLLASMIASTFAMAGDDTEKKSDWDFKGQGVFYYQTTNAHGNGNLFDQGSSKAAVGLQLSAVNKDVIGGIGAGFELSGLSNAALQYDIVSGMVQNAGDTTGGAITQAYLTYGFGNTSMKLGRQHLPGSLSPLAFTEGWNVFKNSYEALLVVNTDIPDTTLVGAYVTKANNSVGDIGNFNKILGSDGALMLTASNKSFEDLTLTGTYYNIMDVAQVDENQEALWFDAKYNLSETMKLESQLGRIYGDYTDSIGGKDSKAFGMRFSAKLGDFNTNIAYSSVNKGTLPVANIAGSGVKSPLYTQGVLNQNTIKVDANTIKLTGSTKALGGKLIASYMTSDLGTSALPSVFGQGVGGEGTYSELELIYKRKVVENVNMFLAVIHQNDNRQVDEGQNFFRVWFKYDF